MRYDFLLALSFIAVALTNALQEIKDDDNLQDPKQRNIIPHAPSDYTFANYLSYVLYAPLYITGPILTFNDYLHQVLYRTFPVLEPSSHDLLRSSKDTSGRRPRP